MKEAGVARQERLGRVFVCMNFGHFCLLSASTLFADAVPDWRLVTAGAKFSDERLRFAAYVGPVLPLPLSRLSPNMSASRGPTTVVLPSPMIICCASEVPLQIAS